MLDLRDQLGPQALGKFGQPGALVDVENTQANAFQGFSQASPQNWIFL